MEGSDYGVATTRNGDAKCIFKVKVKNWQQRNMTTKEDAKCIFKAKVKNWQQ
jgi:hypothetical protein